MEGEARTCFREASGGGAADASVPDEVIDLIFSDVFWQLLNFAIRTAAVRLKLPKQRTGSCL